MRAAGHIPEAVDSRAVGRIRAGAHSRAAAEPDAHQAEPVDNRTVVVSLPVPPHLMIADSR